MTANQWFRYSDFVAMISSQNEGLGKMALGNGDSKNVFRIALLSQSALFAISLFAVSCHVPYAAASSIKSLFKTPLWKTMTEWKPWLNELKYV